MRSLNTGASAPVETHVDCVVETHVDCVDPTETERAAVGTGEDGPALEGELDAPLLPVCSWLGPPSVTPISNFAIISFELCLRCLLLEGRSTDG
jgi:hypothetical protein